jgi:hypothetical protein
MTNLIVGVRNIAKTPKKVKVKFSATSLILVLGFQEVKAPGSSRHSVL